MKKHIKLYENYNSYSRVIPRDFFNEGKLLNCMGVLQLKILDKYLPENIEIYIEESGEPFNIQLDETFYLLYVSNYSVTVNDEMYLVGTPYNSKDKNPLTIVVDDEEILIFNEDNSFSNEFIEKFS